MTQAQVLRKLPNDVLHQNGEGNQARGRRGIKKIGKLIKENSEGKSQETKTGQSQKPAVGLESN